MPWAAAPAAAAGQGVEVIKNVGYCHFAVRIPLAFQLSFLHLLSGEKTTTHPSAKRPRTPRILDLDLDLDC